MCTYTPTKNVRTIDFDGVLFYYVKKMLYLCSRKQLNRLCLRHIYMWQSHVIYACGT